MMNSLGLLEPEPLEGGAKGYVIHLSDRCASTAAVEKLGLTVPIDAILDAV
jgi:hypothetical protein